LHGTDDLRCAALAATRPRDVFRILAATFHASELRDDPMVNSFTRMGYYPPHAPLACPPGSPADGAARALLRRFALAPRVFASVAVLLPHAVARGHLPRTLRVLHKEGFGVTRMRYAVLSQTEARTLAGTDDGAHVNAFRGASKDAAAPLLASVVLLLERENAVQHLLKLLGPSDPKRARETPGAEYTLRAACGVDAARHGVYGSASFAHAQRDVDLLLPEEEAGAGIGSDCLAQRAFARRKDGPPSILLNEVICVVLSPKLLRGDAELGDDDMMKPHAYTQVLDRFKREGFVMVQLKYCTLPARQIETYTQHRRTYRSRAHAEVADPELAGGPALVVAFERENAIARASTIIGTAAPGGSASATGRRGDPLR